MTDNIFDLAATLGFQDLGLAPQGVRLAVAADSEGRAGADPSPGAVPSMPKPLGPPRFGDGRPQPWPRPRPNPPPVPTPPPPFAS
jgi:hypothetical protein